VIGDEGSSRCCYCDLSVRPQAARTTHFYDIQVSQHARHPEVTTGAYISYPFDIPGTRRLRYTVQCYTKNAQKLDHVLLGAPQQLRSACSERAGQRRGLPKDKCSQRMYGTKKEGLLVVCLWGQEGNAQFVCLVRRLNCQSELARGLPNREV
jgi:hypothetical protein